MRHFHSCPPGAEQSDLVVRALEDFYRPLGESRKRIEHLLRREKRLCAQAPELGEELAALVARRAASGDSSRRTLGSNGRAGNRGEGLDQLALELHRALGGREEVERAF